MKKRIIGIIFGLLLVFSFTKISFAANCNFNPGVRCNLTSCSYSGSNYCCFSSSDCTQLQGGSAATGLTTPTSGSTTTTTTGTSVDVLCGNGINTAIGCIPILGQNGSTDFMAFVLRWAVGVGGGIAFLLILYGGFMVMTSAGNPERLKAGQELLTSAISGLILLIFSVFILKLIGLDILGLGVFGFGKP